LQPLYQYHVHLSHILPLTAPCDERATIVNAIIHIDLIDTITAIISHRETKVNKNVVVYHPIIKQADTNDRTKRDGEVFIFSQHY
jgi:hypothetical protein